jgi:hypothetical protein
MASGDDIEAGRTTGASDRTILVGHKSRPSSDLAGDFIFEAARQRVGGNPQAPDRDLDGIRGVGNRGGIAVVGLSGFMDRAGRVLGVAGGVAVEWRGGSGVVGKGGPGSRQRGGLGVLGFGGPGDGGFADGPGVLGQSNTAQGVIGVSAAPSSSGVSGFKPLTPSPLRLRPATPAPAGASQLPKMSTEAARIWAFSVSDRISVFKVRAATRRSSDSHRPVMA